MSTLFSKVFKKVSQKVIFTLFFLCDIIYLVINLIQYIVYLSGLSLVKSKPENIWSDVLLYNKVILLG